MKKIILGIFIMLVLSSNAYAERVFSTTLIGTSNFLFDIYYPTTFDLLLDNSYGGCAIQGIFFNYMAPFRSYGYIIQMNGIIFPGIIWGTGDMSYWTTTISTFFFVGFETSNPPYK